MRVEINRAGTARVVVFVVVAAAATARVLCGE